MKYLILMGLPASGKSTWAEEYKESEATYTDGWHKQKIYHVYIMDIDKEFKRGQKSIETAIGNELNRVPYNIKEIIVDGLFTTNEHIIEVLNNLDVKSNDIVEIHHWKEDREQCLINDEHRRDDNSSIAINNIPFEKVNLSLIKDKTDIKPIIEYHEVCIKDNWKVFSDKYDISLYEDRYFRSSSWSLGGSWGNCWGNSGNISGENPVEFTEFDSLLSEICPSISFLQYKNIYNSCVGTEEYRENDYYGGSESYSYYRCDVEELYNKLTEMRLI